MVTMTDDVIRQREELADQIRALKDMKVMAASYGFDISRPAKTAQEAVQWLYFGYLSSYQDSERCCNVRRTCFYFH